MHFDLSVPSQLTGALGPDLLLMLGAMVLMLWAAWGPESAARQRRVGVAGLALTALVALVVVAYDATGASASAGVIAVDRFRWTSDVIFLAATGIALATSIDFNAREGIDAAESHVLVLFATSGMMLLAAARDLMLVFLGVEVLSVASYVLAGLNRRSARSAEAAIKYFLLGAFSTGFLLYGIALIYGATGSTNLAAIGASVAASAPSGSPLLIVGIALLLVGFGFKIAAAPFHMWAPDVYDGAPVPITGFMAAGVKAAAFATLLRVWLEAFSPVYPVWHDAVWWLAALTMVVGNLIALAQRNLKRLLAYSSIAHTGFVLVAVVAGTAAGSSAFLFYLLAYTLATMGAFAVIGALAGAGERHVGIDDYAGLWSERPWLAVAMTIFMLALLGFPLFGGIGFLAKWYVLQAALQAPVPQTRLAVLLVLTTAVSAGYYLYVVMVMFMRPRPADAPPRVSVGAWTRGVIAATAVLIVGLGLFPDPVVRWTRSSGAQAVVPRPVSRTVGR